MKVYQDACDKYVTSNVFYGKTADHKVYVDAAYTTQAAEAVVLDAFLKGVLVLKVGDAYYKPVKVAANKITTAELVSSTATITEWTAAAANAE